MTNLMLLKSLFLSMIGKKMLKKEKMLHFQHFLLYPQCLQMSSLFQNLGFNGKKLCFQDRLLSFIGLHILVLDKRMGLFLFGVEEVNSFLCGHGVYILLLFHCQSCPLNQFTLHLSNLWQVGTPLLQLQIGSFVKLPHYQTTNFILFQLKEFADDNFKFDENGRKLSKWVKHCGKRRNCSLRAISPFPTVFSKGLFPRGVKRLHGLLYTTTISSM